MDDSKRDPWACLTLSYFSPTIEERHIPQKNFLSLNSLHSLKRKCTSILHADISYDIKLTVTEEILGIAIFWSLLP